MRKMEITIEVSYKKIFRTKNKFCKTKNAKRILYKKYAFFVNSVLSKARY